MAPAFQALVIEDNPSTTATLQNALSRLGWRCVAVQTAEEGVAQFGRCSFDAVFAELCVREQGGRFVARWVKDQNLAAKVFIVTSWKGELDERLLLIDGIHDVVRKPLIFSEVRDRILKHFG
jgi:DNA-binding response OmpR family regulator